MLEPGAALGQVCHYIHLNPVRAKLVSPEKAVDYPWSSLPLWPNKDRPAWLEASVVLGEAGGLPDTKVGWRKYLEYLEFLATDAGQKKNLVAARLSRGWCVGSGTFKQEMRREAAQRGADLERYGGLEPEEVKAERSAVWEEQLRLLAQRARINLGKLSPQKSHPDKAMLASALKLSTSVSNGWLSERLGMGQPASASQFARRWLLDASRRKAVELLLSRVKT